jgi:DNA-binding transcriptional LysR family regulator
MNLQQLRYVREAVRRGLNLTAVAEALYTSQPGVSRQLLDLEDELGIRIFVRRGKRFTGITEPGRQVVAIAERVMGEVDNLKRIGQDFTAEAEGTLTIAATHMQARYKLPQTIRDFARQYPRVRLAIRQGNPRQLAEMVLAAEADVAVATETLDRFEQLVTLPCYTWHHCVVVPRGHALARGRMTLKRIAAYPIITYDAAFTGRTALDETFARAGVETNIVLTAIDTDVIKTYVRLGLGVGIISEVAYDAKRDQDLDALDASKLFPERVTKVAFRRGNYLRGFVRNFIAKLSPEAKEYFARNA